MATLGGDLKKVPSAFSASGVSVAGHEIGYPHGHLGHLNEEEEAALGEFKALLEERGLYKPGPPASSDDQTLLCVSPPLLPVQRLIGQTVPPRASMGSRGCVQAVQGHGGLAQGQRH